MNEISNYQLAEGLSDEQMSALLSEKLGRTIAPRGFRIVKGRKDAPPEWLEALSLAPSAGPSVYDPPAESVREAVKDTPLAILPFDTHSAHMQITMMYQLGGKGAAMVMNAPPVEATWARYAPQIASAYIEWAKENQTVANVIRAITLGGAGGTVILLHGSLLVETLIISGRLKAEQIMPPGFGGEVGDFEPTDFDSEPEPEVNDIDGTGPSSDNGTQKKPTRTRTPRA